MYLIHFRHVSLGGFQPLFAKASATAARIGFRPPTPLFLQPQGGRIRVVPLPGILKNVGKICIWCFRTSKSDPEVPQERPRATKSPQERLKTASRSQRNDPRSPKSGPRAPKSGPRPPQEVSRAIQEPSRSTPGRPGSQKSLFFLWFFNDF